MLAPQAQLVNEETLVKVVPRDQKVQMDDRDQQDLVVTQAERVMQVVLDLKDVKVKKVCEDLLDQLVNKASVAGMAELEKMEQLDQLGA